MFSQLMAICSKNPEGRNKNLITRPLDQPGAHARSPLELTLEGVYSLHFCTQGHKPILQVQRQKLMSA